MAGYPPNQGYPPQQGYPGSYYPQPGVGGPGHPSGYPPQTGFVTPVGGYPPAQVAYPPQGGAYPPPGGVYPPQCGVYPPQGHLGYSGQPPYGGVPPSYGGPPGGNFGGYGCQSVGRPSVIPVAPFDPGSDAEILRKAMKGLGTNEQQIIDVLSKRTSYQRVEIEKKYRASFGKDLAKHLESEISGRFKDIVLKSILPQPEMLASFLRQSIECALTKQHVLFQILVPATNIEVRAIAAAYHHCFNRGIEDDIRSATTGDFEKILVALTQGCREEGNPGNPQQAAADANALYQSGENRLGTEEATFTRILTQRSFPQIREIARCYEQNYGRPLQKAIDNETSGNYEKTMLAIVRYAMNKNELFAEWLHESMAGLGTNDDDLVCLVLWRCEIDMADIKEAYARKYGKSLVKAIEDDTSGDYKKMLTALVGY